MKTRAMIRLDAALGLPLCTIAFLAGIPRRILRAAWQRLSGRRTPRHGSPDRPVRRILVVKFLGMGSILLATPLARVAVALVGFMMAYDRLYTVVAALVLAILVFGFLTLPL